MSMEEEDKGPLVSSRTNPPARSLPSRALQLLLLFLIMCITFSAVSLYMIRHFGVIQSPVAATKPSLQPCYMEPNSLDHWIRPPSDLLHKMSDEELFWRATMVPQIKNYPFKRVPKIAFMFLTKGSMPLAPLWERFLRGHEQQYSIYVHTSPSFHPHFRPSSVFYNRHIPSQVAEWGRMSICDAERRLLANALLDISNERFVLLSESCIPLFNFSFIYNYIARSRYSFVGAFDDPGPYGRGRYNPNMSPEVNLTDWRKGSQWFEINRRLAVSIVKDTFYYPKFKRFCIPACYVDEHYFPTMLTIRAGAALANRSTTWVDWSRGGSHPATFGRADVKEEFLKRIIHSRNCTYNGRLISTCFLFARKFAPSTMEPLLALAPRVLGY
ncbi:hypothetical protein SAY87_019152 [Trapa incisa]|uniref:Core-2/I-branching beta-1,6-N-acetylglucosaminyltransferase family protein n=2 Tax=Trapa TaxID=22665 RepID=A0AAN7LX69_TRANT|nr:hypothetical protein SAY87_019152 [Trapa incisa]KAK4792944.1 hypothetical protein SAY86_023379 [Trapa natans]